MVGGMIIKAALGFAWSVLVELIDTRLTEDEVDGIRATIETTAGVRGLHELRTRRMAHQALVDAHIQVSSRISVSADDHIAETARWRVLNKHPEVRDVLVHIDPEDDIDPTLRGGKLPEHEVLRRRWASILGEDLALFVKFVFSFSWPAGGSPGVSADFTGQKLGTAPKASSRDCATTGEG